MYKRAQQLYETWHKSACPMRRSNWDGLSAHVKRGWYDVAAAEAALLDQVENRYLSEYQRLRKDMATMVKRKHYTDAIKSLSMCQNQIETLMIELKRWNPTSVIARDASTVLGLLESMIMANPDMQTTDWKADAKAKADEAEEKRRAVVQAAMWKDEPSYSDGWEMADKVAQSFSERYKWTKDNVGGAVGKDYKP